MAAYDGAGCDELFFFPSSSDAAQVDLLADAAGLWSSASAEELEAWLERNHAESDGIWLKVAKKGVARRRLRRSADPRPLLRLDRQPEEGPRRDALPAALHPAPAARQVVADQPRQGRGADRRRAHAALRAGRGRGGEGRRPLAGRLRGPAPGEGASRPAGRARPQQGGRASSSPGSTAPIATRSSTGSTRPRSRRRGSDACGNSSRCSSAAKRSTERRASMAREMTIRGTAGSR